jgi:hypothetical protein
MPWPTYSERFLAPTITGQWRSHLCPAGYREVIKCVTIVNDTATAGSTLINVAGALFVSALVPAASTVAFTQLHVPLYGGEDIGVFMYQTKGAVTVSGYRFREQAGGSKFPVLDQGVASERPEALPAAA